MIVVPGGKEGAVSDYNEFRNRNQILGAHI